VVSLSKLLTRVQIPYTPISMSLSFLVAFIIIVLCSYESSFLSLLLLLCFVFVFSMSLISTSTCHSSLASILLLILFIVVNTFVVTSSLFVFFVMFELSLVPICLLILLFGYQPEKLNALLWLLTYTVVCSAPFLYFSVTNVFSLYYGLTNLSPLARMLVCLSFIVKAPLYSLHSWLPKAHVEAPLLGSMLLAGIMLKLGGYGLLVISPRLGYTSSIYLYLTLTGGVICSTICYRYWDMKSLVAFSSVVHIGAVTLCALSGTDLGFNVALLSIASHSLLSPLLFSLSFELYQSTGSRNFIFGHYCSVSLPLLLVIAICSGINFGLPPFIAF